MGYAARNAHAQRKRDVVPIKRLSTEILARGVRYIRRTIRKGREVRYYSARYCARIRGKRYAFNVGFIRVPVVPYGANAGNVRVLHDGRSAVIIRNTRHGTARIYSRHGFRTAIWKRVT